MPRGFCYTIHAYRSFLSSRHIYFRTKMSIHHMVSMSLCQKAREPVFLLFFGYKTTRAATKADLRYDTRGHDAQHVYLSALRFTVRRIAYDLVWCQFRESSSLMGPYRDRGPLVGMRTSYRLLRLSALLPASCQSSRTAMRVGGQQSW
jgi:hypothetical protein